MKGRSSYSATAMTFIAAIVSMILSTALLFSWQRFADIPAAWAILLFILVCTLLTMLALAVLQRTRPSWSSIAPRTRLLWLVGATLAGWLLTWMIPLDPTPATVTAVEVESLGTKSPASKGSEVWVKLLVDGRAVELDDVDAGPIWTAGHGYLISPINSPPDYIRWKGRYTSNVYVEFFTHEWSGQAAARWDGRKQEFDLYSATGSEIRVLVAGKPTPPQFLLLPSRTPLQYLVQACQSVTLGLVLLAGLAFAARWPSTRLPQAGTVRGPLWSEVLLAALPLLLIGSALLVIFLPAIMTTDSLNQWAQAESGRFDDGHPVLYAFYLWLIRQVVPSPTLAAWVQMTAMALASGWLATVVRRACNAPRWTSIAGGLLVAAYPLTSLTSITLWKDVPYATSVVALTAFVVGNLFLDRPGLRHWYNCLALALLAAACMALRHNGPPVAAAALFILMLRPGTRLRVLASLLLAVGILWGIKGPLSDKVGTHRANAAYMAYTHHLSAHLAAGQLPSTAADSAVLDAIDKGEDDWRYRCSVVNSTVFDDAYDIPTAVKHQDTLFRVWLEMAIERPDVELDHVLCASGMVWRYRTSAPLYLYVFGFEPGEGRSLRWIQPGLGGPVQASPFPETAWRIGRAVLKPEYVRLWRPAPFLVGLCLLTVVAYLRTRDRRVLLIPVLVLIHSAVLMVAIIAQDARYQLPLYLVFLLTAPALALARRAQPQDSDIAGRAAG